MKICDIVSTSFGLKCNVYGQMVKMTPKLWFFRPVPGNIANWKSFGVKARIFIHPKYICIVSLWKIDLNMVFDYVGICVVW